MTKVDLAEKIAKQWICPNAPNNEPQTIYEYNAIKEHMRFALHVMDQYDALRHKSAETDNVVFYNCLGSLEQTLP